jgi:hypothetical protein
VERLDPFVGGRSDDRGAQPRRTAGEWQRQRGGIGLLVGRPGVGLGKCKN